MAKWFKEHLGFRNSKAPPPAPPKPDYRHCPPTVLHTTGCHQTSSAASSQHPSSAPPDIVAAYKLQKQLDFEDPYTGGGNTSFSTCMSYVGSPEGKCVSPKHRLVKVETIGKGNTTLSSGISLFNSANFKCPPSPRVEQENREKLFILDDYADPFDAEQAGGTRATIKMVPENDGYMEPYEAQKMMAEICAGLSPTELPLYDTPYDPAEHAGNTDPDAPPFFRESRLPQDDDRPPEEYDQPWEWKKDQISKAFAVEVKAIEDLPWPPPVGQHSKAPQLTEEAGVLPVPDPAPTSPRQATCDQQHPAQFIHYYVSLSSQH